MSAQASNRRAYARVMARVLDHIETHLDDELSLDILCRVAHSSRFHFHRQFTAYTGITVARLVQLLRLKRASRQLVFNPARRITDIALDAGYQSAESFSRAFKQLHGQSPSAFRRAPQWQDWQTEPVHALAREYTPMQVDLVEFPETLTAGLEHHGPERLVYDTTARFIAWRKAVGLKPDAGRTYGLHYSGPGTLPQDYRMDICVSVDAPTDEANEQGVTNIVIPGGRCARARHFGSRDCVAAAGYLYREWLPASGEQLRDCPLIFHYLNVGPDVMDADMITDVYLPLA